MKLALKMIFVVPLVLAFGLFGLNALHKLTPPEYCMFSSEKLIQAPANANQILSDIYEVKARGNGQPLPEVRKAFWYEADRNQGYVCVAFRYGGAANFTYIFMDGRYQLLEERGAGAPFR